MATNDVRVRNARGVRVRESRPGAATGARRGRSAARAKRALTPLQALLASLADQELQPVRELSIEPLRVARGGRRALRAGAARSVDVEVDVDELQSSAVLLEQDGELSWHFPEPSKKRPRRGAARRRAAAVGAPSSLTIPVRLREPVAAAASGRRRIGISSLLPAAKAFVLKFVARTAAGASMQLLERNVHPGLIVMDGDDPRAWRSIRSIDDLSLPNEPLRIMLWVHGTFSSTVGGFAALTATADGRTMLARARKRYHAVLGFDHATLSATPLENALNLAERLGRFARPMQIDAVMHSRGGLVFRSLVELVLPTLRTRPEIGTAVFVGVPNAGTSLAEPDNWRAFVDLYSNLATGAFSVLAATGVAAPAATILGGLVSGLGAFVKYLANTVITERSIPGLAAMEPGGAFLTKLNAIGAGQPLPDDCRYLAVTANFDARAAAAHGRPIGLAPALLRRLADGLSDRLFRENNDLVVNEPSMKQIDVQAGSYIDAALDFGDSATVYHTVYFSQQQVAQQLNAWLLDPQARAGLRARPGTLVVLPSPRRPFTRVCYNRAAGSPRRARTKPKKRAARASERDMTASATAQLGSVFGERDAGMDVAGVRAPSASARRNYAPKLASTQEQVSRAAAKGTDVHVVSYCQTHRDIPIFGTRANVELDASGQLVAVQAKLAHVTDVARKPKLSRARAAALLAQRLALTDGARRALAKQDAKLNFFHDRNADRWHLTYCFTRVPARPPANAPQARAAARGRGVAAKKRDGHRMGPGPRQRFPLYDYLVDAGTGALVYYYSRSPTAARRAVIPPGVLQGVDDEGLLRRFFGLRSGKRFELRDPARFIRTHDLADGDMDVVQVPRLPISSAGPSFDAASGAGVSAHVNSGHVLDFYNRVLFRHGIDDQGMQVINVVNCTAAADEEPPQWNNACWYENKMWYGQVLRRGKKLSLARYLDIVGHELTHGVTEKTCDLVYREEPGALNESFSDIFGVIINNCVRTPNADARDWDWLIGPGLGETARKPLRNMANPAMTGDPAHVKDMPKLRPGEAPDEDTNDLGYVHTNSNVHNRAAYNLLTATLAGKRGKRVRRAALVFAPEDIARLYYYTLQRLDRTADFEDVYFALLDTARTYFPGDEQAAKLAAITRAYAAVGIPRA